jgi:hypothetical protein
VKSGDPQEQEFPMAKFSFLALILLVCLASFSCQTYTSGLKQSLTAADEAAASRTLLTINTAQLTYSSSHDLEYGTFQQLSEGGYLDSRFNSDKPVISGYVLTMEVGRAAEGPFFHCHADPAGGSAPTTRHLYIDALGYVRAHPSRPATATDQHVQ